MRFLNSKLESIEIEQLFTNYGNNYVVQRSIKQHPDLSLYNKTSVNTLRITTLYLNGEVTCLPSALRIGNEGAIVDNLSSGGWMVGISQKGELNEWGVDYKMNHKDTINGVVLKGQRIKFVPEIIRSVMELHETDFSLCKLIGWDICVDSSGEFICIEINSSQPGISGVQVVCGRPLFGDRTQEVISYCVEKEFKYNRGVFNY